MEHETMRNQYHPAFCGAMTQEFHENRNDIECTEEYNLNTLPNKVDLLVVKKMVDTMLVSGLGKIFRKWNLIEYKSPEQSLGIDTYKRSMGYAYLFSACTEGATSMEELTLTFVREGKPVKLMGQLKKQGFAITKYEPGIYHVRKAEHVDMQIIVTRELDPKYVWIKSLSKKLTKKDAEYLAQRACMVSDEVERNRIITIMDLVSKLNRNKEWMKEWTGMGAFRDLFKEEFEEKDRTITELSKQLKKRDKQLQSKDEQLQSKDEQLQSKDEQLQSKDEQLQSKDEQLQNKDEQLQSKDEQLQSKDEQLQNMDVQLTNEKEKNSKLQQEIDRLRRQLNKTAMF